MATTYRVTFRKRFNQAGEGSNAPVTFLDLPDGLVLDSSFVETFEPDSVHVEEGMEEDDDFMAFGTEVWEFEVAENRDQEFKDALTNSGVVVEYEEMDKEDDDIPAGAAS